MQEPALPAFVVYKCNNAMGYRHLTRVYVTIICLLIVMPFIY